MESLEKQNQEKRPLLNIKDNFKKYITEEGIEVISLKEWLLGGEWLMHRMNLWNDSFEAIKDGWKTIEMRLNDEKRNQIKIGDEIEFTSIKTNETLICKVTNLFRYKNFDELYNNHNKISIGYAKDESANPDDVLMYYAKEDIERYGVLGIELIKIGG